MADTKTASDALQHDLDKEIAKLRKDVEKLTALFRDVAGNAAGLAKETFRDRVGQASEDLHAAMDTTTTTMRRTVNERPLTALALAIGLGFVLGQILRR